MSRRKDVVRTVSQVEAAGLRFRCACRAEAVLGSWVVAHLHDKNALPLQGQCEKCGRTHRIVANEEDE